MRDHIDEIPPMTEDHPGGKITDEDHPVRDRLDESTLVKDQFDERPDHPDETILMKYHSW